MVSATAVAAPAAREDEGTVYIETLLSVLEQTWWI